MVGCGVLLASLVVVAVVLVLWLLWLVAVSRFISFRAVQGRTIGPSSGSLGG